MNELKWFVTLVQIVEDFDLFYHNVGTFDYDDGPLITKTFRIQDRNVTIPISIIASGDMVEPPENFTVELEIPEETKDEGVVAVEPSTAEIVITDGMKFLHSHTCTYETTM